MPPNAANVANVPTRSPRAAPTGTSACRAAAAALTSDVVLPKRRRRPPPTAPATLASRPLALPLACKVGVALRPGAELKEGGQGRELLARRGRFGRMPRCLLLGLSHGEMTCSSLKIGVALRLG
jgi:hypothetical protein